MSQDNHITLRGYLTAEPRLFQTERTQAPMTEIRVGSTPRRLNRTTGEWLDGEPSYYTVKCWRRLAVNVASSLRKGDMVLIRGKVVMRTWVDDQQRTRTQMQVEADSVGHDLAFGWSRFIRGVQAPAGAAQNLADGEVSRQAGSDDPEANGAGPNGAGSNGGEPGGGEPGGQYDDYLAAGLPVGDNPNDRDDRDDGSEQDEQDDQDNQGDRAGLPEPAGIAPAF